jgi:magnesium-transporting ATPase (P-type)
MLSQQLKLPLGLWVQTLGNSKVILTRKREDWNWCRQVLSVVVLLMIYFESIILAALQLKWLDCNVNTSMSTTFFHLLCCFWVVLLYKSYSWQRLVNWRSFVKVILKEIILSWYCDIDVLLFVGFLSIVLPLVNQETLELKDKRK